METRPFLFCAKTKMNVFEKLSASSQLFLQSIKDANDDKIASFIIESESLNAEVPQFPAHLEWLNCSTPLSLQNDLAGKLVVLDFFTYCCINCMHVIPDLHALEEKFSIEDGVVVIGVHSAKFENEKVSKNIKNAILRYGIQHAVANDSDALLWNQMSIQCWPTFVIVSPDGKCLLYMIGEGNREALLKFVNRAVAFYQKNGKLKNHPLPLIPQIESSQSTYLRYPGKVCVAGLDVAVTDSGNHRVLLVSKDGVVNKVFGGTGCGQKDGTSTEAQFNSPQGVTYTNGSLFVADTDNHCIRKVDIDKGVVATIAGTGKQGNDKEGGKKGCEQEISSPWDVTNGPAPGSPLCQGETVLYIAMAGTHQIWSYFLEDGSWLKKGKQTASTCLRFAGSGNEENRNNSYPHKAAFAQPSGLTISSTKEGKRVIYVADSESSSIRSIEITNGAVKACVGGEKDPMNLFAFGDKDGKGVEAKLQHPLGLVWNPVDEKIYFTDSYNHKIKVIDVGSCTCTTLAGTGKAGLTDGSCLEAQFDEPGGIDVFEDGKTLIVADTNNHCLRIIDLEKQFVSKMNVFCTDEVDALVISKPKTKQTDAKAQRLISKNAPTVQLDPISVNLDLSVPLSISILLPDECHFTDEAQSRFAVKYEVNKEEFQVEQNDDKIDKEGTTKCKINISRNNENSVKIVVELLVYFCSPDGVCLMKNVALKRQLKHDAKQNENCFVTFPHSFSM